MSYPALCCRSWRHTLDGLSADELSGLVSVAVFPAVTHRPNWPILLEINGFGQCVNLLGEVDNLPDREDGELPGSKGAVIRGKGLWPS